MTADVFEKAIALPDTVWGYFEWLTGVVRVNIDYSSFEEDSLLEGEKKGLNETYYHEIFHCCQICTTGFLYYHVAHFLKGIAPIWSKLTADGVMNNATAPEIVGKVTEDAPELSDSILKLFANMDEKSINFRLTTRELIEGQAYFVQKLLTTEKLSHDFFLRLSSNAPSKMYTKAYHITTEIFGESAFIVFNAIVFESLCYLQPQNIFYTICKLTKAELLKGLPVNEAIQYVSIELRKEHFYLGNSLQVTRDYIRDQQLNPFYSTNISILQEIGKEKNMGFAELMARPEEWFKNSIKNLDVFIILNPSEVYEHIKTEEWKVFDKTYNKKLRLILAAICLVIYNKKKNKCPQFLHLKKCDFD